MSHHDSLFNSEMLANKIDGAPDAAQAVASATLVAKADSISQPAPWSDMVKEIHDLVKQNQALAKQNHALATIVQQAKSREQRAAHCYGELEKFHDQLFLDYRTNYERHRGVIADLEAQLAKNNAELISELRDTIATLQDTITTMEEAVDAASWTESRQNQRWWIARIFQKWRSLLLGREEAIMCFTKRIAA